MKSKAFGLTIEKLESLPARGVWVEINVESEIVETGIVTPRTGSVG